LKSICGVQAGIKQMTRGERVMVLQGQVAAPPLNAFFRTNNRNTGWRCLPGISPCMFDIYRRSKPMRAKRRRSLPLSGPAQQQARKIEATEILLSTVQVDFPEDEQPRRPPFGGRSG
jgi:hypothetical protein